MKKLLLHTILAVTSIVSINSLYAEAPQTNHKKVARLMVQMMDDKNSNNFSRVKTRLFFEHNALLPEKNRGKFFVDTATLHTINTSQGTMTPLQYAEKTGRTEIANGIKISYFSHLPTAKLEKALKQPNSPLYNFDLTTKIKNFDKTLTVLDQAVEKRDLGKVQFLLKHITLSKQQKTKILEELQKQLTFAQEMLKGAREDQKQLIPIIETFKNYVPK